MSDSSFNSQCIFFVNHIIKNLWSSSYSFYFRNIHSMKKWRREFLLKIGILLCRILLRSLLLSPMRSRNSSLVTFYEHYIFSSSSSTTFKARQILPLQFALFIGLWAILCNAVNIILEKYPPVYKVQVSSQNDILIINVFFWPLKFSIWFPFYNRLSGFMSCPFTFNFFCWVWTILDYSFLTSAFIVLVLNCHIQYFTVLHLQ